MVRRIIHWLLAVVIVLYIVTGFGITEFRTVEALTFGLLTKNLAFRIHDAMVIPLIVLLALHIFFSPLLKLYRNSIKRKDRAMSD